MAATHDSCADWYRIRRLDFCFQKVGGRVWESHLTPTDAPCGPVQNVAREKKRGSGAGEHLHFIVGFPDLLLFVSIFTIALNPSCFL